MRRPEGPGADTQVRLRAGFELALKEHEVFVTRSCSNNVVAMPAHEQRAGHAARPCCSLARKGSPVRCVEETYGTTITVEPVACAPVDVVAVTKTVIVPLPGPYVRVC